MSPSQIPIEDFFEDILGKSMRGLGIGLSKLSAKTGVPAETIEQLARGKFVDEVALVKIAPALGLDPSALTTSASKAWYPKPVSLDGIAIFNTPYHDMRVNAFLVWDPETKMAAAFDTGTDSGGITNEAEARGLTIETIFLTHTHNDHIADLDRLAANAGNPVVYANREEPWPGAELFEEGASLTIGNLAVEARTTSGHSIGGTTYVITGLENPVAVVGDAMFAGSMGGGMISFEDALENNRKKIMTLPDDTILCPGHGPMTTVGEEKRHNPFFPEL